MSSPQLVGHSYDNVHFISMVINAMGVFGKTLYLVYTALISGHAVKAGHALCCPRG